ncbi:hypothetical protein [uncultured Clostridium sp.]|jgi:hypothetical protein|uniref:hypothetical protein n=1 Tax=uncultured Clostridium sp. TaxID=59620 RepID=UPI00262C07CB|nr:hypothetical protein [uncultured Clostridium sp.]
MLKFKIESSGTGEIKFRAFISEEMKENRIIKRALFESKIVKSSKEYPYLIPIKYFIPIVRNIESDLIKCDEESIDIFFEFSDEYEEKFFYAAKATVRYMKKWREEGCPKIYKIKIHKDTLKIEKDFAFERLI